MITFIKRNLKIYFRDKAAVFFSLLAVLIEIGLYAFFLGDTYTKDLGDVDRARELMDNWLMAGVLATTGLTTSLAILGNMIKDKESRRIKDFIAAPIKRADILMGYWIAAYLVGTLMTLLTFAISQLYIVGNGGSLISLEACLKVIGLILLTNLMSTALMLLFVSIFNSSNAFSAANVVFGTLIGFATGIYLPIGMFPEGVQWFVKLFPVSHGAALFRQVMMKDIMADSMQGAPAELVSEVKEQLGVVYTFGETTMSAGGNLMVVLLTAMLCASLAYLFIKKKQK